MQPLRIRPSRDGKKPPAVTVSTAGRLLGISRMTAHRRVVDGSLPIMPLPGRRLVPVALIERLLGRELTDSEIAVASCTAADQVQP